MLLFILLMVASTHPVMGAPGSAPTLEDQLAAWAVGHPASAEEALFALRLSNEVAGRPSPEALRTAGLLLTPKTDASRFDAASFFTDLARLSEADEPAAALERALETSRFGAPAGGLATAVRHADLGAALEGLALAHGRALTEQERLSIARSAESLPPTLAHALMRVISAHLVQAEATTLVLASGSAAAWPDGSSRTYELGLLLDARDFVAREVLAVLPELRLVRQAPALPVVCGVFDIDLQGEPSLHSCDVALSIDLGGDDVYTNNAGGSNGILVPAALAVDVSGDDRYDDRTPTVGGLNGGANGGSAFLLDADGSDRYNRTTLDGGVNGGGVKGVGLLIDLGGDNDEYGATVPLRSRSGGAINGAGFDGQGFLFDDGGDDVYGGTLGQAGAVGVGAMNGGAHTGAGFLYDHNGSDHYGGTLGVIDGAMNGAASGGFSVLFDRSGTDFYDGVAYGQGAINAASRVGITALVDLAGDNHFNGTANLTNSGADGGAGESVCLFDMCPHYRALSILLTGSGNDTFNSTGLTQGSGSKQGLALLLDQGGVNRYVARSGALAQGTGFAQGTGILVDAGNDSTYLLQEGTTGQGAGTQGVGLLLRPLSQSVSRYLSADAQPSLVTGGGAGLVVDRGSAETGLRFLECSQHSQQIRNVTYESPDGMTMVSQRFCTPDRRDEAGVRVNDPITGKPMGDLPKPSCTDIPGCPDAAATANLTDDQRMWLNDSSMTSTLSGGFTYFSARASTTGVQYEQSRSEALSGDRTCGFTCVYWESVARDVDSA